MRVEVRTMDDIIREIADLKESREQAALASLVWSSGSIPMSDRAKMLIRARRSSVGTIGGGCLEAEIINVGREVMETGRPHLTRYTMTEKEAGESGLNCGGTVRILTEPIDPHSDADAYGLVLRAREKRKWCIMATLLGGKSTRELGGKMLVLEGAGCTGTLGAAEADRQVLQKVEEVLEGERSVVFRLVLDSPQSAALKVDPEETAEVFVEPFLPPPVLYVFGGGHVGEQVGRLAKCVGFWVVVVDDRPMFASPERHPYADEWVVEEMDRVFPMLDIDGQSYIVAATRGHQHDEIVVEQAIETPARYIGMLGSERKKMLMWKRIEGRGGQRARLDQVYAPIGFNIGADTPEEIGISVVAELIKVRRGARKIWKTKKEG